MAVTTSEEKDKHTTKQQALGNWWKKAIGGFVLVQIGYYALGGVLADFITITGLVILIIGIVDGVKYRRFKKSDRYVKTD